MKKVFGIGFHKTGTTSLQRALEVFGYKVCGSVGGHTTRISTDAYGICKPYIDRFDAFEDSPWPLLYKQIDRDYPNSKFILTVRPTDEWFLSLVNHVGSTRNNMRKWIYGVGCPLGNEEIYKTRYEKHNREVIAYFKDRPDSDLLILSISRGDGWEKLCPFLGVDIPEVLFPHVNKGSVRELRRKKRRA